jgi:hypothetical protein
MKKLMLRISDNCPLSYGGSWQAKEQDNFEDLNILLIRYWIKFI